MRISLFHGNGGKQTRKLIEEVFLKHFKQSGPLEDAAYLTVPSRQIAATTDSFVINPLFFPGGDIGKLSICGTVNDLVVSGAEPLYITAGFVIEEGFSIDNLNKIAQSMAEEAEKNRIKIVAGDTKVVERGKADGVYINTAGIGTVKRRFSVEDVHPGDAVIITGPIGEHGLCVLIEREQLEVESPVKSDCESLYPLISPLFEIPQVKWMRDPTRGGLATVCLELCEDTGLGMVLFEEKIPVREEVQFLCEMLGFDPLYLANEGRALIVASKEKADEVVELLRKHPSGKKAGVIGHITDEFRGVKLITEIKGERFLDYFEEDPLPRIC